MQSPRTAARRSRSARLTRGQKKESPWLLPGASLCRGAREEEEEGTSGSFRGLLGEPLESDSRMRLSRHPVNIHLPCLINGMLVVVDLQRR